MREPICDWNDNKAARNLRKHGVSFEVAQCVFDDVNRLEDLDDEHSIHEYRFRVIGNVQGVFLTVIYTERGDDDQPINWMISARRSTSEEVNSYYADR